MIAIPVAAIFYLALFPTENIWPHLVSTSLPGYISNTLILMLGVGITVFAIGVSTAWMVVNLDFPMRRFFEWSLLLPLAMPAYVIAYIYTDLLEFAGPVQIFLRQFSGWELASDYWFPEIRSMGGAVLLMGLVLYPYVYLLARAAFLEQSRYLLEASRLLGRGAVASFLHVSLPIARPAIVVGVALALMETLNDFGTVDFFAIPTLTVGLYDVWMGMGNLGGAAQIAVIMLTFVVLLLTLEMIGRHKKRFYQSDTRFKNKSRKTLIGIHRWVAFFICALPVILGFLLPVALLMRYAIMTFDISWTAEFRTYAWNSFYLAASASLIAVSLATIISYSKRLHPGKALSIASKLASLGYAVPGAVLAIGIIIPFAALDNLVDDMMRSTFNISTGLILSGSSFALIFAYVVRFMAVSVGSVEASMAKVSESMEMSARTLGYSPLQTLKKYLFPLIRGGMLTAALIVFVDTMKELPATLILRPFNFETLATHVYQFASDEMIQESALGSLIIVLTGLIPIIILSKIITSSSRLK